MDKINRKFFFDSARETLFSGSLKQSQVDGMTIFLDYWESNSPKADDRWLAYILGTAYHEVDKKMQPIKEYGSKAYFKRRYDIEGENPNLAKRLGNIHPGDGVKYHGRGFVQITGRDNYRRLSAYVDVDLEDDPSRILETEISSKIIFQGMTKGLFTGKKLSDYFSSD
jgi:hypothetical protein